MFHDFFPSDINLENYGFVIGDLFSQFLHDELIRRIAEDRFCVGNDADADEFNQDASGKNGFNFCL